MTKIYEAKNHVGVSVKMPSGKYARVSFISSSNGAYFQTDNKDLQKAIEAHEWYGSIFKSVKNEPEEAAPIPEEVKLKEKEVSSIIEARDLLQEIGVDTASARSKVAIEDLGKKNGIKFNWGK